VYAATKTNNQILFFSLNVAKIKRGKGPINDEKKFVRQK